MSDRVSQVRTFEVLTATAVSPRRTPRRWSDDEKARLVTEAFSPGSTVAEVARSYELDVSQLYAWRRKALSSGSIAPLAVPLGEMQTLATGVGDLKRVLTNVKSRGGWGEVQLGALLQDMLSPEQFARNVRVKAETNELVEYAVTLPGKGEGPPVFLPIDAKFPHEDYDRLLSAQETGVADEIERAALSLERAIRGEAKRISEKYVCPPQSTDFAIMYLPTEGLFAEVIRRPGLCSEIQTKTRVMITGPTTLAALLNSLQMGFRTLAIEKRSSEVWQILSAAKTEFRKYGEVWDKIGKQLDSARKTVDEAGKRTRAVERKLRNVETFDMPALAEDSMIPSLPDENSDEEILDIAR